MGYLVLNWSDIMIGSIELTKKIANSHYIPDMVVGIFRNGWILAKLVSDILGVDEVGGIGIKFYKGIGETRERPLVTSGPTLSPREKRVLVVDDVSDTGRTLQTAIELIKLYGAKEVRTATLYVKPKTILYPDYHYGETSDWIVFPWEYGEVIRDVSKTLYGDTDPSSIEKAAERIGIKDRDFIKALAVIEENRVSVKGSSSSRSR
ncbi:MAG: phosphoribosyltransferase [Sulfolobales archaeon]